MKFLGSKSQMNKTKAIKMNNTSRKLEICCYTVESALIAKQAGADRVECCDNYFEGGTTSSFAAIKYADNHL